MVVKLYKKKLIKLVLTLRLIKEENIFCGNEKKSVVSSCSFLFFIDTFNKLGYKAEINNYTASRVN